MGDTAVKRDPEKWAKAKSQAKAQMGGKHSARAMQLAVKKYKKMGGTYSGKKKKTNKLSKWAKEDWGTKSGKNSTQGSEATGERYLPKAAKDGGLITKRNHRGCGAVMPDRRKKTRYS